MNWKSFLTTIAAVGAAAVGAYFIRKKDDLSFGEYCNGCIDAASSEYSESDDVTKTLLVLAKIEDGYVAPYFYRRYQDGKIRKKRVNFYTFKFDSCPSDVQESVLNGEYILKQF